MRLHYYNHEHTPAGTEKVLKIAVGDEPPIDQQVEWCKANWTIEQQHTIAVGAAYWTRDRLILAEHGEEPTVGSIANHLLHGHSGWRKVRPWWEKLFEAIDRAGFSVGLVFMDIESPLCTRGYEYKPKNGTDPDNNIHVLDAIDLLYADGRPEGFPRLNLDCLRNADRYGSPEGYQTMLTWDHFARRQLARQLRMTFALPAKAIFGTDCKVTNYDFSRFHAAPAMDVNSRLPMADCAVDGVSSPVLYVKKGMFGNPTQAINALDCVKGPIVPVLHGMHRVGTNETTASGDDLLDIAGACARREIEHAVVF